MPDEEGEEGVEEDGGGSERGIGYYGEECAEDVDAGSDEYE